MTTKAFLLKQVAYASAKHVTETKFMPIFERLAKQGFTYAFIIETPCPRREYAEVIPELAQYSHKITNILKDEGFIVSLIKTDEDTDLPTYHMRVDWEVEK